MKQEIQEKIYDLYINQNKSIKFIFKKLKITRKSVVNYLHENNLTRKPGPRKNFQNDLYFNNIDTDEKAYWLGYFYADGNVSTSSNCVILSSTDLETVNNFKKSVNFTGRIITEIHRKFCKKIYKIVISSEQMRRDLIFHGCVPAKSLIITFPKLPSNLISHFIRGYFDGDGSVGIYKNSSKKEAYTLRSSFCSGSKKFLSKLVFYLPVTKKNLPKQTKKNLYSLEFSVNDSLKLANYIYENATIFLTRKRIIFDKYRERRSTTIIDRPKKGEGIV